MLACIAVSGDAGWIALGAATAAAFIIGSLTELSPKAWGWGTYATKDIAVSTLGGPVIYGWMVAWLWIVGELP